MIFNIVILLCLGMALVCGGVSLVAGLAWVGAVLLGMMGAGLIAFAIALVWSEP